MLWFRDYLYRLNLIYSLIIRRVGNIPMIMKGSDSRSLYAIQRLGKIMIGVTEQLIDLKTIQCRIRSPEL
jgi:hypothetical protein